MFGNQFGAYKTKFGSKETICYFGKATLKKLLWKSYVEKRKFTSGRGNISLLLKSKHTINYL